MSTRRARAVALGSAWESAWGLVWGLVWGLAQVPEWAAALESERVVEVRA